ncbi:MFS transporter [Halobacillus litoralis]|uniref:MDR family MFS transporter n=1 Tax=Halobacillus litoralis TaxID=45668 RepID=UPI001CD30EAE|nr:MFS transporter [Halobacillus litoralis]MCA0969539.1 MFS transporter [Halobacillus litoralis]
MFKSLHPNIKVRIYTSFLSRVVGAAVFPFMAIYFTKEWNASVAGLLVLVQVAIQFMTGLYGGYLSDVIGRKRLMVTGEALKVFAFIGMMSANSPWFTSAWITYAMILLVGIAGGLVNPAAEAMLIDVSSKETRAFMYAVNYWAVNLSLMIGLVIGGWFFESHLFGLLVGLLFMSIVTFAMTQVLILESYEKSEAVRDEYGWKPVLNSYKKVIRDTAFLSFTAGGIAILGIEFQRNNFIAVRLEKEFVERTVELWGFGAIAIDGLRLISILTITNTILIVLLTSIVSKWIKGRNEEWIMYAGFVLFGIGYAYTAFSSNVAGLFAAVIVLTIGELMYVPTRQSILADLVDDSKRGAYMAFNGLVFQLGKMVGALGLVMGAQIGGGGMAGFYIGLTICGIVFSRNSISGKRRVRTRALVKQS